jgi:HAD superfamily hydrolase (TIGR01490 family)
VPLALFDLDNTLLCGDSDHLWGGFLVEHGIVDADYYESQNERFYRQYKAGELDILEFLDFALKPLAEHPTAQLLEWRDRFLTEQIDPIILPAARRLVERHRRAGDTLLIITATNRFITAPIAARFDIPHLLATEPEQQNGRYTGRVLGTPCFQDGKVTRLEQWLKDTDNDLMDSHFYTDSHNDLPLLQRVAHPHAVDPDDCLRAHAESRDWPVISLR